MCEGVKKLMIEVLAYAWKKMWMPRGRRGHASPGFTRD